MKAFYAFLAASPVAAGAAAPDERTAASSGSPSAVAPSLWAAFSKALASQTAKAAGE